MVAPPLISVKELASMINTQHWEKWAQILGRTSKDSEQQEQTQHTSIVFPVEQPKLVLNLVPKSKEKHNKQWKTMDREVQEASLLQQVSLQEASLLLVVLLVVVGGGCSFDNI